MSVAEKSNRPSKIYPEDVEDLTKFLKIIRDKARERDELEREEKELNKQIQEVSLQLEERKPIAEVMARIRKHLKNEGVEPTPEENLYTPEFLTQLKCRLNEVQQKLGKLRDQLRTYKQELDEISAKHPTLLQRAESELAGQEGQERMERGRPTLISDQDRLRLFNLDYLREQFQMKYLTPVLIFDGYNVIGAVRRYAERRGNYELRETRDLLLSDLDFLASQIEGSYVVVFDSYHQTQVDTHYDIQMIYAGGNPGEKDKADNLIVDLVRYLKGEDGALRDHPEMVSQVAEELRQSRPDQIFVITNDSRLKERVFQLEAGVIDVGNVFKY